MFIESLSLSYFRNISHLTLTPKHPTIVLRGNNGQGKTNVLEAIYVCATGRSFRHARPSELVMQGQSVGGLECDFVRGGVRHAMSISLGDRRRVVRVDDRHLRQVSDLLQWMNVVAFFPDDLRVVKGSPEERRRFFDRAVANVRPDFLAAAVAYYRVLKARNALLRDKASVDRVLLSTYDDALVRHGCLMHQARVETLTAFAPSVGHRFEALTNGLSGVLNVALQNGVSAAWAGDAQGFHEALEQSYPRDRARGMTTIGPHRSDLILTILERDARVFASQGEQRAVILALKLAEVQVLRAQLGFSPMVLLDDVSSELDPFRLGFLFSEIVALETQVWVTTTGSVQLPIRGAHQVFEMHQGHALCVE